jgi:hypothetical protein
MFAYLILRLSALISVLSIVLTIWVWMRLTAHKAKFNFPKLDSIRHLAASVLASF